MSIQLSKIECIFYFFFPEKLKRRIEIYNLKKEFPCPHCRPDLEYTFFDDWKQICKYCNREYYT